MSEVDRLREALMVAHHCLTGLRGSPLVAEAVGMIEEALSGGERAEDRRGKFDAFTAAELRLLKERVPEWGPAVEEALRAPNGSEERHSEAVFEAGCRENADEGLQETSVDWSREDIERIWDVFSARGLMLDRKSLYYDEGADSDFCEMHRRHLAETLDMAGLRR